MYIKKIKFGSPVRCFKKNHTFVFEDDVTLLVGDQGSGKSSLLHAIMDVKGFAEDIQADLDKTARYLFFDTEKNNPRIKTYLPQDGDSLKFQVASHWASHGETLLPILEYLGNESNKLILIDEPESALSIPSQYKIVKIFREAVERGCQIIVATHSVILMQEFGRILNMHTRKIEDSQKYLDKVKREVLKNE